MNAGASRVRLRRISQPMSRDMEMEVTDEGFGCFQYDEANRSRCASVPAICQRMPVVFCPSFADSSGRSSQSLNDLRTVGNNALDAGDMQPSFARKRYGSGSLVSDDCEARLLPMKLTPRLKELKREASVQTHVALDYAGEKYVRDATQLTSSWSSFFLDDRTNSPSSSTDSSKLRSRANSLSEPVHVLTNTYPSSCSPSPPTRQCYSPSMQQVVRNAVFSESPSQSPSRNSLMRSLSPIAVLSVPLKRKSLEESNLSASYKRRKTRPDDQSPCSYGSVWSARNSRFGGSVGECSRLQHSLSNSSLESESGCSSGGVDLRKGFFADANSELEPSSEDQSDLNSSNVNSPVMITPSSDMEV